MSRVQLALNVDDLESAVDFYSKLFATEPAKVRPGYANFAVVEPPLKLVLFENPGQGGTLNHLGVELGTPEEVGAAQTRLAREGMAPDAEDDVACCYARKDNVCFFFNYCEPWEIYTVLESVEMPGGLSCAVDPETGKNRCDVAADNSVEAGSSHCC